MAIIILININVLNIVVVIKRNAYIIGTSVPLSIFPLEAIVAIRRIEVVSSAIVSCIIVVIVLVEVLVKF